MSSCRKRPSRDPRLRKWTRRQVLTQAAAGGAAYAAVNPPSLAAAGRTQERDGMREPFSEQLKPGAWQT